MKRNVLLIVVCLAAASTAFGVNAAKKVDHESEQGNSSGGWPVVDTAHMSDDDRWACEVAMCMSNPSGPTAVAECVPPIQKLHRELAKGHAFPKCPFVSSGGGGDNGGGGGNDDGRDRTRQQIR